MHERLITLIWITIPCFWSSGFERCSIRAAKSPCRAHEALSRAQPTRPSTTTLTQIGPSGANWVVLAVVALVAILVGLVVWGGVVKAEQTPMTHPTRDQHGVGRVALGMRRRALWAMPLCAAALASAGE